MSRTGDTKINHTKAAFFEAFCRLCREVKPEMITVSMLCREAGINRTTFYKYYAVPTDVIVEKTQQLMAEALKYTDAHTLDTEQTIRKFCQVCYDNKELMQLYMSASGDFGKLLYRTVEKQSMAFEFLKKRENVFLLGGLMQVAIMWMMQGYRETPEEMTGILLRYTRRLQSAITDSI